MRILASYAVADLDRVRGHRQVTGAYLASLAADRVDARLATLDEGPERTLLVPALP